jgi:hypothetical protein
LVYKQAEIMKKISLKIFVCSALAGLALLTSSCTKNLLDQQPTVDLPSSAFWNTEVDATTALMGAYSAVRPLFDRDYYMDGQGEYFRTRNASSSTLAGLSNLRLGAAYNNGSYNPSGYGSGFDNMYQFLYGGVNRTNYVIENVNKMLLTAKPTSIANLQAIIGEAKLLRGMVYFKLISMWGDVPYFSKIAYSDADVNSLPRMPISQIKDSIMADFNYAFDKLPANVPIAGRAAKPAALAFRGKLQLYWACWNTFGWPELSTFKPDAAVGLTAYTAAAADFNAVINNYGLTLFRAGDPGSWGTMGDATVLPNYFYLFMPVANNNTMGNNTELIMGFTHGGTSTNQGEELMRDFGGRSQESSQCWVFPRYEIANRYQSTITGDFCPTLLTTTTANVAKDRTKLNSAVNPASYANRDYRMKATMLWDYEQIAGMKSLAATGMCPYIYKTYGSTTAVPGLTTYDDGGAGEPGYIFRKFVRNYAGQGRSDGDFTWPVMRLADVYLMYAEATNAVNGPQADAIALVNKVRHRGNLPPLAATKTVDKPTFFSAIEQERIVELIGEGQRGYDLRRWRAIERVWCPPYGVGVWRIDTYGANLNQYFLNSSELAYQQCYIFRIPPGERNRNPNLTQNTPWL